MTFAMKKCDDKTPDPSGLVCEDEKILNEYIKSFTVEIWSISEKLYYNKTDVGAGVKPVFNTMNLVS